MRFKRWALALVPAILVAMPAFAQVRPVGLADTEVPGSVIVFPKFVNRAAVTVDGATLPRTEIEIGAVCPANTTCSEHQSVKVRFHWVCPGAENVNSNICPETDFEVVLSVNGKLAFSADGIPINSNSPVVPHADCPNGYLIGWVINPANDQPIKFDGLVGDAELRGPTLAAGPSAGSSTAVMSYKAITIQAADTGAPTGAPIATGADQFLGVPTLVFDGVAGHYMSVTGKAFGDVKFDKTSVGAPAPANALSETFLVLLTLDVRSNLPNNPTFVPLQFFNESLNTVSGTNPNFERLVSTSLEFTCWIQARLSDINSNLNQADMQTRKGAVIAGPATKVDIGAQDTFGPATLIGLVHTIEGTAANSFQERSYIYNMFHDLVPRPTTFVPFPF